MWDSIALSGLRYPTSSFAAPMVKPAGTFGKALNGPLVRMNICQWVVKLQLTSVLLHACINIERLDTPLLARLSQQSVRWMTRHDEQRWCNGVACAPMRVDCLTGCTDGPSLRSSIPIAVSLTGSLSWPVSELACFVLFAYHSPLLTENVSQDSRLSAHGPRAYETPSERC